MSIILRDDWKKKMLNRILDSEFDYTTSLPMVAKWLVIELSKKKLAFRMFNLGCGVRRFTRRTDACPKCHGTGRI